MSSFSMISLSKVPGAGPLRHASNRKIEEGQSFHKDKGKWWAKYSRGLYEVY